MPEHRGQTVHERLQEIRDTLTKADYIHTGIETVGDEDPADAVERLINDARNGVYELADMIGVIIRQ